MGGFSYLLLGGLGLICSFIFTLLKESLQYASVYKLENLLLMRRQGHERLTQYIEMREGMVWVMVTLNMVVNMGYVVLMVVWLGLGGGWEGWGRVLLGCVLLLLLGEVFPKILGNILAESVVCFFLPVFSRLYWLFRPLLAVYSFLTRVMERLFPQKEEMKEVEEDLMDAALEGERFGVLGEESKRMIENILKFRDLYVSDVMVPRTDLVTLREGTRIGEAVRFAMECGYSRIPVFRESRDNIVGILYVKDLFQYLLEGRLEEDLTEVVRKPYFVPETKRIGVMLREFRFKKLHIAIVLDEYGGTAGLITMEDILEELVGDIVDEYDVEEEEPLILRLSEDVIEVDARVRIDELNSQRLGFSLPEDEDFETVGGFVFSTLGRIPRVKERFRYGALEFIVMEADDRRVNRVRILLPSLSNSKG